MSSTTMYGSRFTPKPPDKGSFPIDHEGVCKLQMVKYMKCLQDAVSDNTACRKLSMDYLKCRMDNKLMEKETWKQLGYADIAQNTEAVNK